VSLLGTLDRRRAERGSDREDDALPPIDPRIDARRRDVAEVRHRRRRRAALVLAVIVTILGAAYGISRSAALDVDDVVVTGASRTPVADIRAASGVHLGDHLVELDLDRAAGQIRALPWIRDVSINRSWYGTIDIAVEERVAVAAVHPSDAAWLLVDADRRVVAVSDAAPADLPVIEGVGGAVLGQTLDPAAQAAIDVAAALSPGLRTRVITVQGAHPDAIELRIRPAAVIRFGRAEQIDQKIRSLQALFAQADLQNLCAVDIRVPDSPVLTRGAPCA
jgi:cell division protein FtsQ